MSTQFTFTNDGNKKVYLLPVDKNGNRILNDPIQPLIQVNPGATIIASVHEDKKYLIEEL